MKGRDLLILAAIVLVAGFAVADALRETATSEPREARPTRTEPATTSNEENGGPENGGPERFPAVPGAGGNFVFTEVGSCPLREVDLPSGLVFLNVVRASTCELWGAPVTAKVAVGIGGATGDTIPFRFLDLLRPNRELGSGEALFGALVWSEDGQRAAWCNGQRIGFDLELGGRRRTLPDCPGAYSPDGQVVYVQGDRLFVEDRPGLRASGTITKVHYGNDGSLAVVVEGRRIERYVDGELTDALDLEERYHGRLPALSPDNCSVALSAGERVRILDVGCSRLGLNGTVFPGHVAAWSPNGEWIAIGGPTELAFYDLTTDTEPVVWPVGAVQLAWRRS
jgi:hypothetical protein